MFQCTRIILSCILLLSAGRAHAQVPPPVDIPIPNLMQETQVWCWAAVAQQIIHFVRGPAQTPARCALVAMANGAHPQFCCNQRNPACVRTGSIQQISALIGQFGGRFAAYAPPADPMTVYQTLASGRAIILHIRSGMSTSHVVVLRGMSFIFTPQGIQPVLHINDPLAYYTQPVLFAQLAPLWIEALVIN